MRKIQTKNRYDFDVSKYNELVKDINLITYQRGKFSEANGGANGGDNFEADYFAVGHIIDFCKDFEQDMKQMIKVYKEIKKLRHIEK